jgi:hypothetical protein
LLSCSQTPSALLVLHGAAMQITESARPLSKEVCIEWTILVEGIGKGPAACGRIAKRKPSSSVAWSVDNMVEPPPHVAKLVADGGYEGPQFRKPITKVLLSLQLKSSIASTSSRDRRRRLRARSTVFRQRLSGSYSAS